MVILHRRTVSSRRVLIVDDDADTVEIAALIMQAEGYETRSALNGVEALARAAAFRPHLVLLDIAMPGIDGLAVAAAIRSTDWGKDAALIAVTGLGSSIVRTRCAEVGFDHYILKPMDYTEVSEMIRQSFRSPVH